MKNNYIKYKLHVLPIIRIYNEKLFNPFFLYIYNKV